MVTSAATITVNKFIEFKSEFAVKYKGHAALEGVRPELQLEVGILTRCMAR